MTTSKDWMKHNHDELYRQAVQTQTYLGVPANRARMGFGTDTPQGHWFDTVFADAFIAYDTAHAHWCCRSSVTSAAKPCTSPCGGKTPPANNLKMWQTNVTNLLSRQQPSTAPSFRPECARNERTERRNLLQHAGRCKAASTERSRFLDSASLRSE
ncbi:MAG: hypothetical protein LBD87_02165 [Prevotellaceae bacterium]|nr:hypothetical protein [Prevotellaceae bacterium]